MTRWAEHPVKVVTNTLTQEALHLSAGEVTYWDDESGTPVQITGEQFEGGY